LSVVTVIDATVVVGFGDVVVSITAVSEVVAKCVVDFNAAVVVDITAAVDVDTFVDIEVCT
jgi:hypothetical protein